MNYTETAYERAIEVLRQCCGPCGLKASGQARGHHEVWARDSMMTALGARFVPDLTIQEALRATISQLRRHQSPVGAIPNYVDANGRPNFRAYADGSLWWLIGSALLAPDTEAARQILCWCEHQDVDHSGLLSMQEAADWQDLFCTRGKGLYLNCLYVLGLKAAAKLFEESDESQSARCLERACTVRERINDIFWYRGDGNLLPHFSHTFSTMADPLRDSLGRPRWIPAKQKLASEEHYLPFLGFRAVGEWFDSLGNLLAILAGIADENKTNTILNFISRHALDSRPLPSLTPVVRPGDPDWRDYYGSLNQPHLYHNGGVWPFIGGFYVAALVKAGRGEDAACALRNLAELNLCGEFNEWHHGETGEPLGVKCQAWSAGLYLFAYECVRRGEVDLF